MAIYHMQAKVVSRGSGRSAVAASAYMSCSRMYNDYDGIQHDYTRKQGLIYQEVMLPPMAPLEWNDREQLWNAVEETEKTKDSRLAREFVVALPVELDKDSNISLLQNFIKKNFVDMGMCADFAIHDTDGHNPHAHILLTVRPLNENGTWQYKTEKEYLCIKDGEELIVKNQKPENYCVLNYEDPVLREFGQHIVPKTVYFSSVRKLDEGIYLDGDLIVLKTAEAEIPFVHTGELKDNLKRKNRIRSVT